MQNLTSEELALIKTLIINEEGKMRRLDMLFDLPAYNPIVLEKLHELSNKVIEMENEQEDREAQDRYAEADCWQEAEDRKVAARIAEEDAAKHPHGAAKHALEADADRVGQHLIDAGILKETTEEGWTRPG